jgi:hypothetical protein
MSQATVTVSEAKQVLDSWIAQRPGDIAAQKAAVEKYGVMFRPANLANVTEDDFRAFLLLKNNMHWTGIHRHPNIYADMGRLRAALEELLDESKPIDERLNRLTTKTDPLYIKGMGRAVLTPILMCVYPNQYAVYNRISEEALTRLGRNNAKAGDSFGKRYLAINAACKQIANEIGEPLSSVDAMFSLLVHGIDGSPLVDAAGLSDEKALAIDSIRPVANVQDDGAFLFPLEKYLEDFLVSNWDKTTLGKTLALHAEDEEDATQYQTDLGPIDILARDKATQDWVVIELKRGKSSDAVVGQLLRYMGWVKKHKAASGEKVRGIIITSAPDERIRYAMLMTAGISFYTYRVSFDLLEEQSA